LQPFINIDGLFHDRLRGKQTFKRFYEIQDSYFHAIGCIALATRGTGSDAGIDPQGL
jgi:hypothetical protein